MNASQFIVARDDLKQSKFIETALPAAKDLPGEALLVKVERFAFTANNITYALAGDQLKYWNLFPAPQGFGTIPVWGFGDVIASRHPNIGQGERLFGYFPMATHLVVDAADVSKARLARCGCASPGRGSRLQRLCPRRRRSCLRRAAGGPHPLAGGVAPCGERPFLREPKPYRLSLKGERRRRPPLRERQCWTERMISR
jgi:hypothetical protein